jgi:hypothetical protein
MFFSQKCMLGSSVGDPDPDQVGYGSFWQIQIIARTISVRDANQNLTHCKIHTLLLRTHLLQLCAVH